MKAVKVFTTYDREEAEREVEARDLWVSSMTDAVEVGRFIVTARAMLMVGFVDNVKDALAVVKHVD